MISALKELAMDSQPLSTGLPSAQRSLTPFLIMKASSDGHLRKFDVGIVEDAFRAALTAHSARLDTAEGCFRSGKRKTVDADHSRFQPFRRLAGATGIPGEDIGGKAHFRGIGALEDIIGVRELRDGRDGTEILLGKRLCIVRQAGNNRRLEEEAGVH